LRRILLGHAHDELFHILRDTGTAKLTAVLTAIKLLRDQSLVPAHERVGRGDGGHLFETCTAERMGQCGEAAAFGVGQVQPAAAEMGFEDTVFLSQVGDDLLLMTLDPTREYGEQELEDHGLSSGWRL
jgi:hypothetical protein